jgi:hypothetical protein
MAVLAAAATLALAPSASVLAKGGHGHGDGRAGHEAKGHHGHNGEHGGKKAIGAVASFDPATGAIVIDLEDGTQWTGAVSSDAQVKLEHRGHHSHGHSHGNPSHGTLEDLVAGAKVLRIKSDADDVISKIRIRPAATGDEDTPGDQPPADDDDTTDDDTTGDDTADDDSSGDDTTDDDTSGEEEPATP